MFGLFRYILACMVVLAHLWPSFIVGIGAYAVFGFYILSGYLMTLVLNEVYGFTKEGMVRFMINRGLRIYPPYMIVLFVSLFLITLLPDLSSSFNITLQLPSSASEWLKNIGIFGITIKSKYRLVPPSWSLSVELFFYIAMAVVLVRTQVIAALWFSGSVLYTIFMITKGYNFDLRYFPLEAASLPFSTGAVLYYTRQSLNTPSKTVLAVVFYILNIILTLVGILNGRTVGFYVSYAVTVYLMMNLISLKKTTLPDWYINLDKLLGDLAYPIFLCHWLVAVMVSWLFFSGTVALGRTIFFSSFLFINMFALFIHFIIETKVNALREQNKKRLLSPAKII